jgi:CRISPR system Cascade subunit CasE
MSETLLVRARLKQTPSMASIATLLLPTDTSRRADAAHRLVWSLFAGNAEAERNFLWREDSHGVFYILAQQSPGVSDIFDLEVKPFAPNLAVGDQLLFSLRANATRTTRVEGARRGKRADVVMAAIKPLSLRERSEQRRETIRTAGTAWLAAQGEKHGFELPSSPLVDGYNKWKIPRPQQRPIEISVLDFDGVLRVTNVEAFNAALRNGFGHAKVFGCGLMLIRRA